MAGCIVVLIFLFTAYHRNEIEAFFTSMFNHDATSNVSMNAMNALNATRTESLKTTIVSNATNQHFTTANCSKQQTIGLCTLFITFAISTTLSLLI